MSKLLNNLPIEDLTEENDYLGIIDKGQIIKTFLESNTDEFKDIKMFSLYGEWGSGKSTLMKYLQKELKGTFNTFFFEAWQFEKDDNLSVSFLEFLLEKSNTVEEEFAGDLLKFGGKLLRGLGNSVQFKVPLYPEGPTINLNPSKFVDEFTKVENITFYKALEKFKTDFRKWENLKNDRKDKDYNIIFIDDLDRCEPENVLNLLSALKLFFTYGEKTIFFCGIDKKAIKEAVKTKYGEVVKANEYLEKIFDISFNMPEHDNLLKLISQYFDESEVLFLEGKLNQNVSSFLRALKFTNPRRVKKLLNKYSIVRNLKEELHHNHKYGKAIPNVYTMNDGNYFETILTLYIIILHEFRPNLFDGLFDLKYKESILIKAAKKSADSSSYSGYLSSIKYHVDSDYTNKSIKELDFDNSGQHTTLVFSFLPNNITELGTNDFGSHGFDYMKVDFMNIEYKFLSYILTNSDIITKCDDFSNLSLREIKNGIKNLL